MQNVLLCWKCGEQQWWIWREYNKRAFELLILCFQVNNFNIQFIHYRFLFENKISTYNRYFSALLIKLTVFMMRMTILNFDYWTEILSVYLQYFLKHHNTMNVSSYYWYCVLYFCMLFSVPFLKPLSIKISWCFHMGGKEGNSNSYFIITTSEF